MHPSSSPAFDDHGLPPAQPPLCTQPSVLAWQGSPDHKLRAQILAAARERPHFFDPTQRPPSPSRAPAVPQQLRPRRSVPVRSHASVSTASGPGAGTSAAARRPRHNAHASSSTLAGSSSAASVHAAGVSPLLAAWSTNSLAAVHAGAPPAGLAQGKAPAVPAQTTTTAAAAAVVLDENAWDLAQILSEVDARVAARRRAPQPAPTAVAAAPTTTVPPAPGLKGRPRAKLSRSVSVDRLPVGRPPSAGAAHKTRDLSVVVEHPRSGTARSAAWADGEGASAGPARKRLKRSTSSGTALHSSARRARSPSWDPCEDALGDGDQARSGGGGGGGGRPASTGGGGPSSPSSGAAYDDGMDWGRTVELICTPPGGTTSSFARPAAPPSSSSPTAAAQPPRLASPLKRKQKQPAAPSPLKQTSSADLFFTADAAEDDVHRAPRPPARAASQSSAPAPARLGMCRSASTTTTAAAAAGGSRMPRFRPPFKPPSQTTSAAAVPPTRPSMYARASPAAAAAPMAVDEPPSAPGAGAEDTSFDSFDGMLASLDASGELDEVYRLVDGR